MRWIGLLVALLPLSCDRLDAALPALSLKPSEAGLNALPTENPNRDTEEIAKDRNRVRADLRKLRQRLTFTLPSGQALPSCKGVHLPKSDQDLVLTFVDARTKTKSLLPRRVSERLESVAIAELLGQTEALETKNAQELRTLESVLETWQTRRYVGVLFITDYGGPALILRVGELKRSWYPGKLAAQFAVMDTVERQLVCAFSLQVKNDTSEAPIRSRLQADTRARLERELAITLVGAAAEQLRQELPGLKLPETLDFSPTPARL